MISTCLTNVARENKASASRIDIGLQSISNNIVLNNANKQANLSRNLSRNLISNVHKKVSNNNDRRVAA